MFGRRADHKIEARAEEPPHMSDFKERARFWSLVAVVAAAVVGWLSLFAVMSRNSASEQRGIELVHRLHASQRSLTAEIENLRRSSGSAAELEARIAAANQEFRRISADRDDARMQQAVIRGEIETSRRSLVELETRAAEERQRVAALRFEVASIEQAIAARKQETAKAEPAPTAAPSPAAPRVDTAAAEAELNRLEGLARERTADLSRTEALVQQAQARKTALDADLTRAAARVDELGREGTRLEAGLKDLRTTRDRVASEIETASAQRELLQAEVATLTEAVAVQRAESSTLANLLTAAKAELTETRGELNAKRGELTEASIKLDEMRALKDSIVRPVKVPEGEVSLKPDAEAADEATGAISPAFPAAGSILPPPRPPAKTLQRTPRRPAPVVREAALPARVSPPKPQARRSEPAEVAEETDREETEVAPRTSPTRRNRASERGYAELSRVPAGALELPDSLLPLRPPASGPRTQFP
jgi:septal ring factor EnvC (AmiA/AmiB activator)